MLYKIETPFIDEYLNEIIATIIIIIIFITLKQVLKFFVNQFAKKAGIQENRINLLIKYLNILVISLFVFSLIITWGVQGKDIVWVLSSVSAVIGVAFFAQWSILSNVTAGIILFFSFPFKIGDRIRILDKDFPLEAEIEDIKSFYTSLKTKDGEIVSYPNSLLLQKGIVIVESKENHFLDI